MTDSTKPYLIRAIYEWCVDQGFTPYLAAVVDEHTRVPPGYARDGQIVLNLSPDATNQLNMANDVISFQARFGGVAQGLSVPVGNVVAIYARENGQGMAFEAEVGSVDSEDEEAAEPTEEGPTLVPSPEPAAASSDEAPSAPEGGTVAPAAAPKSGGRGSHLKVIK